MPPNVQLLRSYQNRAVTLRTDSRKSSDTNTAGYVYNDETLALAGDEDAPYGKHPPFPAGFSELGFYSEVPDEHIPEDSIFPLYPVEFFRTFTLCVDYTPGSADNTLEIVVYNVLPGASANYVDAFYFPISFIAPTSTPLAIAGFAHEFSSRTVAPQVLVTLPAENTSPLLFTVSFDVAPYAVIGITAAEVISGEGELGSLRLYANANT